MNEFNAEKSAIEELECHRDEYNYVMAPGTCDVAIQALEKQMARNPVNEPNYECDQCSSFVGYLNEYCHECGQEIDWSEEE